MFSHPKKAATPTFGPNTEPIRIMSLTSRSLRLVKPLFRQTQKFTQTTLNQKMITSFGKLLRTPSSSPIAGRNFSEIIFEVGYTTRQNEAPPGRCRPNPASGPRPWDRDRQYTDRDADIQRILHKSLPPMPRSKYGEGSGPMLRRRMGKENPPITPASHRDRCMLPTKWRSASASTIR